MLPWVENLLPWPRDSSESMDYFISWSAATIGSLICEFETPLKGFRSSLSSLSSNWRDHQVLDINLDLDKPRCVYESKHF